MFFPAVLVIALAATINAEFLRLCAEKRFAMIHCKSGIIEIKSGLYGRNDENVCPSSDSKSMTICHQEDVTSKLQRHCGGSDSCFVTPGLLQVSDTCKNTSKYLDIQYTCTQPITKVLSCNGKAKFTCSSGYVIKVLDAYWGRKHKDVCRHWVYTETGCSTPNTLSRVREQCDGRSSCDIQAKTFGNPCWGREYFEAKYTCAKKGSCGISGVKTGRVIAGEDSKDGQWPWQIAMYKNGRFSCGGSLITPQWIVTAAHCVQRTNASSVTVVLGDLDRATSSGHEQKIHVSKIIYHSKYGRLNYDIALLKLSKPAILNDYVRTICLPNQDEHVSVGSKCFISGWGKTKHPGGSVNKLQHASMTIISKSACSRTNSKVMPITDQMVCAKNAGARQSGCHGDSGGPFVCREKSGAWTLHGAVSWGSRYCNINDAATVFARISELRQWIDITMSKN